MHGRMAVRPLILVTCWRRELPTFLGERTRLDTLDPAYAERVADAGGRPLLVSRAWGTDRGAVEELVRLADGLVLTGGGDVDPVSYGGERENVAGDDAGADAFELGLIDAARAAGRPTLAICRGAQLLAVAHGGALAQRPPAVPGHTELTGLPPGEILAARHPVALTPGSRLSAAFGGADTIQVNTIHHHQIVDAGELAITATAPGGVVEGIEPRTDWPCVAVQWHPEKMGEPEQRGLFERLVQDARERQAVAAS